MIYVDVFNKGAVAFRTCADESQVNIVDDIIVAVSASEFTTWMETVGEIPCVVSDLRGEPLYQYSLNEKQSATFLLRFS